MTATPYIPTAALEGGRVLWRHWQHPKSAAQEGWLVEFSDDGRRVRIRKTRDTCERGIWMNCREIRIDAELSEHKAPDERRASRGGDDE